MENKWCPGCKTLKPVTEFGKNKRRPDGLQSVCSACRQRTLEQKENRSRRADLDRWSREAEKVSEPAYSAFQVKRFNDRFAAGEAIFQFIKDNARRYVRGIVEVCDLENLAYTIILANPEKKSAELEKLVTQAWERIKWHERKMPKAGIPEEKALPHKSSMGLLAFLKTDGKSPGSWWILQGILRALKLTYRKPGSWGWASLDVTHRISSYIVEDGKKMSYIKPISLPKDLRHLVEFDPHDTDEKLERRKVKRFAQQEKFDRDAANWIYRLRKDMEFDIARDVKNAVVASWEAWEAKHDENEQSRRWQVACQTAFYLGGKTFLEKLNRKFCLGQPAFIDSLVKIGESIGNLPPFDSLPAIRQDPIKMTFREVWMLWYLKMKA